VIASRLIVRRTWYVLVILALAWSLIALATGGVGWMIGPLRVSSRQPFRPALLGVIGALVYAWRFPRAEMDADGRWLLGWLHRSAFVIAPLVIVLGLWAGIHYGSFAAGGSDSYGYLSQAPLWLHGDLHIKQPWVAQMTWPQREWTFTPLGYRPSSPDGTIVPTYSPGLPMLMAVFLGVFGANGPFYVVPVLGAVALLGTYLLGVELTRSRAVGACAALFLLASPTFLAHLMLPMTDAPMAAGWTLAMYFALRDPRPKPLVAGLMTAVMLLMRPNLLLLAAAPVAAWLWPCLRGRSSWRDGAVNVARFAAGVAPAVAVVAAVNTRLYGSPLETGYGGLSGGMYDLGRAPQNLRLYFIWLLQSQTAMVAFAAVPLFVRGAVRPDSPRASVRAGLATLFALMLVSYIFYYIFDAWFYLRFLLPALPALFVLMAAGIRAACKKLPLPAQAPAALLLVGWAVLFPLTFAQGQSIFKQYDFEQRYVKAAAYVKELTTPNAMILSVQHSGSVRYYANRITLRYDFLAPDGLDAAIRELIQKGYRPYIVIDDWEEVDFRKRFGALSRVGRLDWRPLVRIPTSPQVRIYDPEGRATP
jgi:hypothetical protein